MLEVIAIIVLVAIVASIEDPRSWGGPSRMSYEDQLKFNQGRPAKGPLVAGNLSRRDETTS